MAILSTQARQVAFKGFIDELNSIREPISTLKGELQAAIDAADQWLEDNAASFNSALPVAARTKLTSKQKARLLVYVIIQRYGAI